jgi:hypothetical protein
VKRALWISVKRALQLRHSRQLLRLVFEAIVFSAVIREALKAADEIVLGAVDRVGNPNRKVPFAHWILETTAGAKPDRRFDSLVYNESIASAGVSNN